MLSAEYVQLETWKKVEWENARKFIWSDTHMRDEFDRVCNEVMLHLRNCGTHPGGIVPRKTRRALQENPGQRVL
jgi:hypothetical protein